MKKRLNEIEIYLLDRNKDIFRACQFPLLNKNFEGQRI